MKSTPFNPTRRNFTVDPNTMFTTPYDVVKHTATIHTSLKKLGVLSDDFVLAKFTDKEKIYIQEQIKNAMVAQALLLPLSPEVSKRVYNMLTNTPQIMAVLSRNQAENHLVKIINQIPREEDEEGQTQTLVSPRKKRNKNDDDEDEL